MRHLIRLAAASLLLLAFCGCGNNAPRTLDTQENAIACASNLRHIQDAKKTWAEKSGKGPADTPSAEELDPFFRRGMPVCPGGGTYTIGKVEEQPQCSIAAHNEAYKANSTQ